MADEKKEFRFIKETVKTPDERKKRLRQLIWALICAACAAIVAAFVFVAFTPVAERALGREEEKKRVQIASADSSVTETPTPTPTPTATPTPTPTPEPEQKPEKESAIEVRERLGKEIAAIVAEREPAIVQVSGIRSEMDYFNIGYESEQQASGLIIAEDDDGYYILTEYRVLDGAERIRIRFTDDTYSDAQLRKQDVNTGLAVVQTGKADVPKETQEKLQVATLGSSALMMRGETVFAMGSPLGYAGSVSTGTLTSLDNEVGFYDTRYHVLTTDLMGSQSGSGALFNLRGEVVGIILQTLTTEQSGVVTAIGVSELTNLMRELSNADARAFAGIRGDDVTEEISAQTEIPQGMIVMEVRQDSPAMLAGIKQQDVIVQIDGAEIKDVRTYAGFLAGRKPGDAIEVKAMRKGVETYEEITFELTLGEI